MGITGRPPLSQNEEAREKLVSSCRAPCAGHGRQPKPHTYGWWKGTGHPNPWFDHNMATHCLPREGLATCQFQGSLVCTLSDCVNCHPDVNLMLIERGFFEKTDRTRFAFSSTSFLMESISRLFASSLRVGEGVGDA
jgi:hypothetical protein